MPRNFGLLGLAALISLLAAFDASVAALEVAVAALELAALLQMSVRASPEVRIPC